MIEQAITKLQFLCDNIPGLLAAIDDESFLAKPDPERWSTQEIIGHLIDSAANNHHRFVRGQFEDFLIVPYDQNSWNTYNYYRQMDRRQIISFWESYNRQLIELWKQIPIDKLDKKLKSNDGELTISFLIDDYVAHQEHHLRQVVANGII